MEQDNILKQAGRLFTHRVDRNGGVLESVVVLPVSDWDNLQSQVTQVDNHIREAASIGVRKYCDGSDDQAAPDGDEVNAARKALKDVNKTLRRTRLNRHMEVDLRGDETDLAVGLHPRRGVSINRKTVPDGATYVTIQARRKIAPVVYIRRKK